MECKYKIGDLVWAKMKFSKPWPALIIEAPKDLKKPQSKGKCIHCCFFLASNDYNYLFDDCLQTFDKYMPSKSPKSGLYLQALREVQKYFNVDETFDTRVFDLLKDSEPTDYGTTESPTGNISRKIEKPNSRGKVQFVLDDSTSDIHTPSKQRCHSMRFRTSVSCSEKEDNNVKLKHRTGSLKKNPVNISNRMRMVSCFQAAGTETLEHSFTSVESPTSILNDEEHIDISKSVAGRQSSNSATTENFDLESEMKALEPGKFTIGFIGYGTIGSSIVKNLIKAGHKILIWNRTKKNYKEMVSENMRMACNLHSLVRQTHVICCCVSDSEAVNETIFGQNGILQQLKDKTFIQMSGIDTETSLSCAEAITSVGGKYLEAQINGSKQQAIDGKLLILVAGEKAVFEKYTSLFDACCSRTKFLGSVGNATRMFVVLQLISGATHAAITEAMSLAGKIKVPTLDLIEVLKASSLNCPLVIDRFDSILQHNEELQINEKKDMQLALKLGERLGEPLHLAATCNELYKSATKPPPRICK